MLHRSAVRTSLAGAASPRRTRRAGSFSRPRVAGALVIALVGLSAGYLLAPGILPATWLRGGATSTAAENTVAVQPRATSSGAGTSGGIEPGTPTAGAGKATPAAVLTRDDVKSGLLEPTIVAAGSGDLVVVPGDVKAPGRGPVRSVRVEVEAGLPVDVQVFATFVMATLNDPRSWGVNGRMTFARTDGAAEIRVVIASPKTVDRLCAPLATKGTQSCGHDGVAALNFTRWVQGIDAYGANRTAYRQHLVNHETGHLLGHPHEDCPGAGQPAPVMQQQTVAVKPCLPNAWPYPVAP